MGVSSIFIFKESAVIKNNLTLGRISEISVNDVTTMSRLRLWKMSIKAAQDRPIFGYGANNMRVPLDKYYDYNLTENWFDSSHNKFFDELLAHGYIGLGLQVAFFITLFVLILKRIKEDTAGNAALFALLVSYIVQSLFIFDVFIVSLSFIFILGFLFVKGSQEENKRIFNKKITSYITVPFIVVLGFIFYFVYSNSIYSARNMAKAYSLSISDIDEVIELYQQADEKMFANHDILASTMAKTAIEVFNSDQVYTDVQLKKYVELTAKAYNKAIDNSGHYSYFYINLAKIYQLASKMPRLDYVDESIGLLNEAMKISPGRIDTYYALAQGYFLKGDFAQAEKVLYQALDFGVRQQDTYYNLAQIQARKGNSKDAIDNINNAQKFGHYFNFANLEEFVKIFVSREDWPATLEIFLKMHELDPNNLDTYYNIALSYSKNGERDKAVEWANKISALDPSRTKEVQKFISGLK
jgi:tetratricopeptide (TPR) repeat protein